MYHRAVKFLLACMLLQLVQCGRTMQSLRELHRPVDDDRYVRKASGKCVCIFDFDETLRVWKGNNGDTPAADGQGIIRRCKEMGYEIAIASANCNTYKLHKVLPQIDSEIFTESFFQSNAFQHCDSWKTNELTKILRHYNTEPECAMFFDDQYHNVHLHARNVGVNWRHVDGHTGVTWNDFWGLRPEMERRCGCT